MGQIEYANFLIILPGALIGQVENIFPEWSFKYLKDY